MKALVLVPDREQYPREAVLAGLDANGIGLAHDGTADMLVTWTPWRGTLRGTAAKQFAGRPVIVLENGWLSPIREQAFYQVALDGWNGGGRYPAGGAERFRSWRLNFEDWHEDGNVLVVEQRGHRHDDRTMPPEWHDHVEVETDRHVKIRWRDSGVPLGDDLAQAYALVTWSSAVSCWALLAGVPVFYAGPSIMLAEICRRFTGNIDEPLYAPRAEAFERASWAQWTAEEIAGGQPFRRLLECGS